ncbi:tRNA threonylcarbamoyladenosine biosynthesis protein TsaB [Aquicella lusitana]|uniref:tRNA threonylcarbamoyladenosine biosynthesis protein TsaB n=1 Tax=Aquicella lusitana TaxID=254246 RepID=A0A370GQV9_9COXI|nr:tRNA threonylcarbamoyladenosine biosynthesis protein TsaB [Aquicella lusitana]VVC73336.1 tRNA threonylcarbamoyladenosine biosynthesis protein TsaB [Aquicella lusitana]
MASGWNDVSVNILAFDTSSSACSIALRKGGEITVLHEIAPMQQARLILPMIQAALDSFSLTLHQLDAIAYGCGPGSFTGIRIASCTAQGLGFASAVPLVSISSLAALAQTVFMEQGFRKLLVALDARMGQVYWAAYEAGQEGRVQLIHQEQLCAPDEVDLPTQLHTEQWYGVGDGWEKYGKIMSTALKFEPAVVESQLPSARAMLELAEIKLQRGEYVTAGQALPAYLR